jgi:hypothetical protein
MVVYTLLPLAGTTSILALDICLAMVTRNGEGTREQGIEFGDLAEKIDTHTYPVTSTDLIEAYGDYELELPDGTRTLRDLFEPFQDEQFQSPADARQTVFNVVDEGAIGRKGYSDRTPPAPGEDVDWSPKSF